MRQGTGHATRSVSNAQFSVFTLLFLCLLLPTVLLFSPSCRRDVSPPDLSNCTRIEVSYSPSTLDHFLPDTGLQRSVLSPSEREYVESFEFFTVTDPERIQTFADDVSLGYYDGRRHVAYNEMPVFVRCYGNNDNMISLTIFGDLVVTEDSRHFRYPRGRGLPNISIIEPPEMQPFKLRFECGLNMQRLYTAGPLHRREVSSYPEPNQWCDAIVRLWENMYTTENGVRERLYIEEEISAFFRCPSVGGRLRVRNPDDGPHEPNSPEQALPLLECHYAMNPDCEPNSPPDTVLLFETKAGWNQHGGPELFTFDNHDPKGGCVLLNDGTVKFIRTKQVLLQLRWE